MDFIKFLEQSKSKKKEDSPIQLINEPMSNLSLYQNIRKGDYVKVIYKKDSILNVYKNYIGEIREYKKGNDTAVVFFHCINGNNRVKISLDHLIKIDN